jgi:hypothetical protein
LNHPRLAPSAQIARRNGFETASNLGQRELKCGRRRGFAESFSRVLSAAHTIFTFGGHDAAQRSGNHREPDEIGNSVGFSAALFAF